MGLASFIENSFRRHQDIREVYGRWTPSPGGLPQCSALLVQAGPFLWMFCANQAQSLQKRHSRKPFVALFLKAWGFWREGILFSSELHNGAFTEPPLKGIATAFVWKGVSFGRVCWCRQTGWWLTKVIRLWNLASSLGWYVFCVWKDDSQETKAFWRSPLQDTPKSCCRTGSGPGASWFNQYSAGTNEPAYQSWDKRTFGDLWWMTFEEEKGAAFREEMKTVNSLLGRAELRRSPACPRSVHLWLSA